MIDLRLATRAAIIIINTEILKLEVELWLTIGSSPN